MFSYLQSQPCLLLEVPEASHVCYCARCTVPNSVIFTGWWRTLEHWPVWIHTSEIWYECALYLTMLDWKLVVWQGWERESASTSILPEDRMLTYVKTIFDWAVMKNRIRKIMCTTQCKQYKTQCLLPPTWCKSWYIIKLVLLRDQQYQNQSASKLCHFVHFRLNRMPDKCVVYLLLWVTNMQAQFVT